MFYKSLRICLKNHKNHKKGGRTSMEVLAEELNKEKTQSEKETTEDG